MLVRLHSGQGDTRQAAFEKVIRHAWRMRDTMMIHVLALYRDVVTRDSLIKIPVRMRISCPGRPQSMEEQRAIRGIGNRRISARLGIAKYQLLNFEAVSFSEELVPATPLKLPDVEPGEYRTFLPRRVRRLYVGRADSDRVSV